MKTMLGQSLGEGLAGFTNNYLANKAMEGVINDRSLHNATQEERSTALQRALEPYGDTGLGILQRRMGIEQQREQRQHQQKEMAARKVLAKELGLSEEIAEGLPAEVLIKAKQSMAQRPPPGGVTAQPVPQQIGNTINKILNENKNSSAEQLASAFDTEGIPPIYTNKYVENRRRDDESRTQQNKFKADYGFQLSGPILKEANEIRATLPIEEGALEAMQDAITTGDQSFWSLDNLADKTGIEAFRTAKGGQFKAASKNFLVNNVAKFGARPNMYIEQQVADMLPKVGRSEEANRTALEMLKFEHDIKQKRIEAIDNLSNEYLKTLGYVPATFGQDVDKSMKDWVKDRQKQLAESLKGIAETEKSKKGKKTSIPEGTVKVKSASGVVGYIPKANLEKAKAAGYVITD